MGFDRIVSLVERILRELSKLDSVKVVAKSSIDGVASASILKLFLEKNGVNVEVEFVDSVEDSVGRYDIALDWGGGCCAPKSVDNFAISTCCSHETTLFMCHGVSPELDATVASVLYTAASRIDFEFRKFAWIPLLTEVELSVVFWETPVLKRAAMDALRFAGVRIRKREGKPEILLHGGVGHRTLAYYVQLVSTYIKDPHRALRDLLDVHIDEEVREKALRIRDALFSECEDAIASSEVRNSVKVCCVDKFSEYPTHALYEFSSYITRARKSLIEDSTVFVLHAKHFSYSRGVSGDSAKVVVKSSPRTAYEIATCRRPSMYVLADEIATIASYVEARRFVLNCKVPSSSIDAVVSKVVSWCASTPRPS